jgi:hypothetical protein
LSELNIARGQIEQERADGNSEYGLESHLLLR